MSYHLLLNATLLQEGDLKSLTALFNDLSGLNFARTNHSSWLDKMSAQESYVTYLKIKAAQYAVVDWQGQLKLISPDDEVLRVHLFETHSRVLAGVEPHSGSQTG